jgi:uncharacterized protein
MPAQPAARSLRISTPDGRVLAIADVADTPARRLVGLLAHDSLADGKGLVITPCGAVHTWFMKFSIDVLFLDRADTVVRVASCLPPFRLAWGTRRAVATIELPAGTAARAGVAEGMRLTVKRSERARA